MERALRLARTRSWALFFGTRMEARHCHSRPRRGGAGHRPRGLPPSASPSRWRLCVFNRRSGLVACGLLRSKRYVGINTGIQQLILQCHTVTAFGTCDSNRAICAASAVVPSHQRPTASTNEGVASRQERSDERTLVSSKRPRRDTNGGGVSEPHKHTSSLDKAAST